MSEVIAPKKLAIIDGNSVFYRGYYAMPNLSTKDGTPTGGVYGFAVMALEVIKRLKPDYVCVAWDKPKTNIRKRVAMYPEYKAGRKPPPPDFYEQIPVLHELLDAFGWPLYELDDYEADDIMGSLAVQAADVGIDVQLVTSDLDMLQLVHPKVHVYALKKGLSNIELFRPETFIMKYGILPEQFLDMKALKGDSSDNIPGVPGIGEKGAIELLKQFKTLDGVYENLELTKESLRKKLEAGKESAYLSKKIAAIWTDAPVNLDLSEVDGSKVDPEKVRDLLQKLEFRTLVRQLPEVMRVQEQHEVRSVLEHGGGKIEIIDTETDLKKLDFDKAHQLFLHSRCAGKHGQDPLILILSVDGVQSYVLDLVKLSKNTVQKHLKAVIENDSIPKIGYDIKSTIKMFYTLGINLKGVKHDVLIGAFLLNSLRREQTLTELANADLDYQGSQLEDISTEELMHRASEIMLIIEALYQQQTRELKNMPRLLELAETIEWPVISVLAAMEYEGIELDTSYLKKMSEQLNDTISDLEQQIYGYADQEFNINSPMQLADILFNKLDLSKIGIKKGKTGFSTAASELDKLRTAHPIIDLITQYREVTKLKNTYVDTLPTMVDDKSRVHTTFALTVAQTGRLSSNDPNLQNIPVRTDLGKHIRTAFVAGRGKVLVGADYSQFELRIAAYLCDDLDLIDMFNKDVDVHLATAAEIYGREPEDITKNMRRDAKVVNFGVMYGLSAHGLVQATGMTYEQAQHFIKRYFEVRPKLLTYIDSVKEKASQDGYVENLLGRRRPTPDVHSSNFAMREAAMRAAVNMPFQGSAADIMKLAMVKIQENFDRKMEDGRWKMEEAPKMLLQIHDSVIVECPEDLAEEIAKLLKETMENAYKLPVKLTVDTSMGKNWGEL
ncbi:DNA polymerase I [Candidatus Saccharibacteria bacterium]|nr:DNA polymerase I [Candidatus Saccharibacteria bacterium]MBI3338490.1 DNA polymerase I [Candidatus Saccharibacteria bacterium]